MRSGAVLYNYNYSLNKMYTLHNINKFTKVIDIIFFKSLLSKNNTTIPNKNNSAGILFP